MATYPIYQYHTCEVSGNLRHLGGFRRAAYLFNYLFLRYLTSYVRLNTYRDVHQVCMQSATTGQDPVACSHEFFSIAAGPRDHRKHHNGIMHLRYWLGLCTARVGTFFGAVDPNAATAPDLKRGGVGSLQQQQPRNRRLCAFRTTTNKRSKAQARIIYTARS